MTERRVTKDILKTEVKDIPPKTYVDFAPPGDSGKKFHLSPGDVDPTNVGSRREHMRAYYKYMFPKGGEATLNMMREESVKSACVSLNNSKFKAVGKLAFEFLVDRILWAFWSQGHSTPDWPWAKYRPNYNDMSVGRSPVYHEWLMAKNAAESNKPAAETGGSSDSAPKGKTQVTAPDAPSDAASEATEAKATPDPSSSSEATVAESKTQKPVSKSWADNEPASEPVSESLSGPLSKLVLEPKKTKEPAAEQGLTRAPVAKPAEAKVERLSSSMWAPKAKKEPGLKPVAAPVARPAVKSQGPYRKPPIPNEGHREQVWVAIFGDESYLSPVCGPFEVLFPRSLPFESFVVGPDGAHLKRINEELIPGQLVITWGNSVPHIVDWEVPNREEHQEKPWPERLIVGFSPSMSAAAIALKPNQRMLQDVWEDLCCWAFAAWGARPVALHSFLANRNRENMAYRFEQRSVGLDGPLQKAYEQAQENGFHSRKCIETHIALSDAAYPVICGILEQSQEDVLLETLEAWVFAQGNSQARQRVGLVEAIWVSKAQVGQVGLIKSWVQSLYMKM
ncbi:hypothetical protein G7Z17_g11822 [Cylindrodendrum hubeiense]|uniref:Uncharacterized protein n=1 Tax=Cylindrodendrum hubeiense TaxID=595255 RepID=A0A9P5GWG1_9HYPO|nr:hypothetical protein G7Z17_g11822 [Cylindrodendrum hubeiense]